MRLILPFILRLTARIMLVMMLLQVSGCSGTRNLAGRNVKEFYRNDQQDIDVQSKVYHISDEKSRVYLKINLSSLVVNEKDIDPTLNYGIRYTHFSNYSSFEPLDSLNIVRNRSSWNQSLGYMVDSFDISSKAGLNSVIELVIRDFNGGTSRRMVVDVLRSKAFNDQYLKCFNSKGELQMSPYLPKLDSYEVYLNTTVDSLFTRFYKRQFPVSSPPFSTISAKAFDFTPDRVWSLRKEGDRRFKIIIDRPGIYQLTPTLEERNGASFYYFDEFYPAPKTVLALVEPLRYISTNEEYDGLLSSEEMKKAVDGFWLKIGDNPERARSLIKAYYSRVRWANEHFSSYLEGWKSDRGMCYVVFGPPDAVYRSTASETWLYGEAGNFNALSLTFTKVVNPFTNNDFRLNRSVSLRNPWYRAVEFWRQGRVLTYK